MKNLVTLMLFFGVYNVKSQITTRAIASPQVTESKEKYDSLAIFLYEKPQLYIGQTLFITCIPKILQQYGYSDFIINKSKESYRNGNIYARGDGFGSEYKSLNGRYFIVEDVFPYEKGNSKDKYLLQLLAKDNKERLYYVYDINLQHSFNFVPVGFFEKQRKELVGKKIITRGKVWIDNPEVRDLNTGKLAHFDVGMVWDCVDFTIEEAHCLPSLILRNSFKEEISLPFKFLKDHSIAFTESESNTYKTLFGEMNWNSIVSGDLTIGMTKPMCLLSWGLPKKVNPTVTQTVKTEQWIYENNYLYFEDGVLKAIQ